MFISIHGTIDARETLEELGMKLDSRTFTVRIDQEEDLDDAVLNDILIELDSEVYDVLEEVFIDRVKLVGQRHKIKLLAAVSD